jgi:hypothetical protein
MEELDRACAKPVACAWPLPEPPEPDGLTKLAVILVFTMRSKELEQVLNEVSVTKN